MKIGLTEIKKNAKEQIKIYQKEAKIFKGTQRELEYKMRVEGIKQFLKNIEELEIRAV